MTNKFDEEEVDYLNKNIGKIKRFELMHNYYLKIYFVDGSCMEIEPEYGGLYLDLKTK